MTERMINNRVSKLEELELQKKELEKQITAIKDELQEYMSDKDEDKIETEKFIVRWTNVLSKRFDSTSFKNDMPYLFDKYTVEKNNRRFSYTHK